MNAREYLCSVLGRVKYNSIPRIVPVGEQDRSYRYLTEADMGGHRVVISEDTSVSDPFLAMKVGNRIRVFQLGSYSMFTCRHGSPRYYGTFTGLPQSYPMPLSGIIDPLYRPLVLYMVTQKKIREVLVVLWIASERAHSGGRFNLLGQLVEHDFGLLNNILEYFNVKFVS